MATEHLTRTSLKEPKQTEPSDGARDDGSGAVQVEL
jgi:hypothetical protein